MLDALPHYGISHDKRNHWFWKVFTTFDFFFAWGYLGYIFLSRHHYAVFLCGVLAACPDFIWVARIVKTKSFDLSHNQNRFTKWHARIQRYERPWGIFLEVPLGVALGYLVYLYA